MFEIEIDDKDAQMESELEDEKGATSYPPEGAGPECPTSLFR